MRLTVLGLTAAMLLLGPMAPGFSAGVKRPAGEYTGQRGQLLISVTGRSIELAAFDFPCRRTTGRTSLNDIPIRRARGRWRFSIRTFGIATYRDDFPDENARIRFTGRFTPNGRRVTGTVTFTTPHCGNDTIAFSASR